MLSVVGSGAQYRGVRCPIQGGQVIHTRRRLVSTQNILNMQVETQRRDIIRSQHVVNDLPDLC